MVNFISHQGETNWNPNEIMLYTTQIAKLEIKIAKYWQECEATRVPLHFWWKWCYNHLGKLFWHYVLKSKYPYLLKGNSTLGLCPTKMHAYVHPKTCTQFFIATLFIKAKKLKTIQVPNNSELDEYIYYSYTMEYYTTMWKNYVQLFILMCMNLISVLLSKRIQI